MLTAVKTGMLAETNAEPALPPGPKGNVIFGNLPMLSGNGLATLEGWAREFGDIFSHRAVNLRLCYLTHPRFIEDVLATRNQNFTKGMAIRMNRRFFGEGLLTSEGELWRRQRRLLQPAFHRRQIGRYGRVMVECTQKMLGSWRAGEIRNLHSELDRITLEIVARVLFNLDLTNHLELLEATSRALHARTAQGPGLVYLTRFLPTAVNLRYLGNVRRLENAIYQIMRDRQTSGRSGDDLLSMLLEVRDEDGQAMSQRQVRDELMTLIGAGNDTTTLTLCYAWYLLAKHPEAEARLVAELGEVLGERLPQVEDLPRLAYTERIIKET